MRTFVLLLTSSLPLLAQDPTPPAADTGLPAAGSPAATQLVEKAIEKMLAVGRGAFKTTESQDNAMMRGVGLPFGHEDADVEGGWNQGLVWGEVDGDLYVRSGGRMLAKIGEQWKLRSSKIASGKPAPFTLDPNLLFTILRELPADARKVAHVEADEVSGRKVAILTLSLEGETATEFVDGGAVPGVGGGMMLFAPMGMPELEHEVHLAMFVDAENGDVLRFSAKVYEKNPMAGSVQIQVAGPGGAAAEDEKEDEKEPKKDAAAAAAAPVWKKGLPARKPKKDESVVTFRADFQKLGRAEAPALDDKAKALLRLR